MIIMSCSIRPHLANRPISFFNISISFRHYIFFEREISITDRPLEYHRHYIAM
ncbi:hypothetical protein HanRHA438_Chr01g0041031 [Helianthus annuus]|nr:hypothetical protein HanRHA438_Chr01g0041031 [Helianthus annuus]